MKIRATPRFTVIPEALLATAALVELVHDLVLRRTWSEIDYGWTLGVGGSLAVLWLVAAVAAALRRAWAWPLSMFAALTLMGHGSVLRLGANWMGAVYLVLGGAALALLALHARAWGFQLDPAFHPAEPAAARAARSRTDRNKRRSSWER